MPRILLRGGTSVEAHGDVVLAAREVGVEYDTGIAKLGDGVSTWDDLDPINKSEWTADIADAVAAIEASDVDSVNGRTGTVTGLAEQADLTAEVNRATTAEALLAPKASPTFTGTPAAPTAAQGTNTTQLATTAMVQSEVALLAPKASPTFTGNPTAPTQSPGDNSTKIATTAYVDAIIAAQDAMVFKGVIDCSSNPNYPAADRGHTYRVSVAGKIGGASGTNVEAGDILLCLTDGTASGTQAAVGANWSIIQANLDGAVIGPASSTDLRVAVFSGTSGKLIADGGTLLSALATLASPAFTGNPTAPTASPGDNDTSIATTAFVTAANTAQDAVLASTYAPLATTPTNDTAFLINRVWTLTTPFQTTTRTPHGTGAGSTSGTLTTIAATAAAPILTNLVSAASVNAIANVGTNGGNGLAVYRGSSSDVFAGFHAQVMALFPDASYNETGASTGSRLRAGLMSATAGITNDRGGANHLACFVRDHVNGGAQDTNWQFVTNNAGTPTVADTGMTFVVSHLYVFDIRCAAGGSSITWTIRDLTAGTSATGSATLTLPGTTNALTFYTGVSTVDATARNIRIGNQYLAGYTSPLA